jgi:hypothetical protein
MEGSRRGMGGGGGGDYSDHGASIRGKLVPVPNRSNCNSVTVHKQMPTLIGTNDPGERQQNEGEEREQARNSERDRKKDSVILFHRKKEEKKHVFNIQCAAQGTGRTKHTRTNVHT